MEYIILATVCATLIVIAMVLSRAEINININQVKDEPEIDYTKILEKVNDKADEDEPDYKDVLELINETYGGNDYGNEPNETEE